MLPPQAWLVVKMAGRAHGTARASFGRGSGGAVGVAKSRVSVTVGGAAVGATNSSAHNRITAASRAFLIVFLLADGVSPGRSHVR